MSTTWLRLQDSDSRLSLYHTLARIRAERYSLQNGPQPVSLVSPKSEGLWVNIIPSLEPMADDKYPFCLQGYEPDLVCLALRDDQRILNHSLPEMFRRLGLEIKTPLFDVESTQPRSTDEWRRCAEHEMKKLRQGLDELRVKLITDIFESSEVPPHWNDAQLPPSPVRNLVDLVAYLESSLDAWKELDDSTQISRIDRFWPRLVNATNALADFGQTVPEFLAVQPLNPEDEMQRLFCFSDFEITCGMLISWIRGRPAFFECEQSTENFRFIPLRKKQLEIIWNCSSETVGELIKQGIIRAKKISNQLYHVDFDCLPVTWQDSMRVATGKTPKNLE